MLKRIRGQTERTKEKLTSKSKLDVLGSLVMRSSMDNKDGPIIQVKESNKASNMASNIQIWLQIYKYRKTKQQKEAALFFTDLLFLALKQDNNAFACKTQQQFFHL